MTECERFDVYKMKNTCRACLRVSEDVIPMTTNEINMYQMFLEKNANPSSDRMLCLMCKWLMTKCLRFKEQCQKANDIITETVMDTKHVLHSQMKSSHDFKMSTKLLYIGPDDGLTIEKEDYDIVMDGDEIGDDDDDDIPLVMFQGDKLKTEIKTETQDDIPVPAIRKRRQDSARKGQNAQGFSSRMVRETDEYIVIKLTKEQVLQEMSERSLQENYTRAPYKCTKCVKGYNFEDVLRAHNEKHQMSRGSFLCDICTQYCPSTVSLRGHLKSHTTRYKCKLCDVVRLSRQHLLEHHAIAHSGAAASYKCEKCDYTTNKRTVIQRHVKTHSTSELLSCEQCGKLFGTVESLRVHTVRHDQSKRLQCEECGKSFLYPSSLRKHIVCVHERSDCYCVECDVRFKSPESLRIHFKKAKRHRDSSSFNYPCPQCPQRFVTSSSLAVHLSAAHGAARRHACATCRRLYASRDALRAHTWRIHGRRTDAQRKNGLKTKVPIQNGDLQPLENHSKHENSVVNILEAPREC